MVQVEVDEIGRQIELNPSAVVVGIPAFNVEDTIAKIIIEAQKYSDIVVVCDDGSSDHTCEIAEKLGADVVSHEHNLGYGAAIQSLFRRAKELDAEVLVTLDGDGQHNPEEIPRLIDSIFNNRTDVVVGSRFADAYGTKEMPVYRQVGVKIITFLTYGFGKNGVTDAQSGFRAYGKRALDVLEFSEDGMSASVEILRETDKQGLKMCEVPISCKYANHNGSKTSTHNPLRHGIGLVMSIIKLIIEDHPLTYLGIPGAVSLIMGSLFGIWTMETYYIEQLINPNTAVPAIALVLTGFFAISTAITLSAISRISLKANGKNR